MLSTTVEQKAPSKDEKKIVECKDETSPTKGGNEQKKFGTKEWFINMARYLASFVR